MDNFVLKFLGPIGIHHMAPEKWAWLICMLVCSTIQLALVVKLATRKFFTFPVLTTYLLLHLFAPAHWLTWWDLRWELCYSFASLAVSWESVCGTFWVIAMESEGQWDKVSSLCIAVTLLGAGLLASPGPYPNSLDQRVYYLHLYVNLVSGSMLAGSLLCAWHNEVVAFKPQIWSNCILLVWFTARCWGDKQIDPADFFSTATLVTLVSAVCLLAWHVEVA